ncbi:hypothetical protein GCM10010412_086760 [Nonomuraea recticatena]|uniref:Uncharacterized protein n=1 Tax=Nonomuraea recticatena TaxID=46178 RepID=A0ABP6FK41_9ACTN
MEKGAMTEGATQARSVGRAVVRPIAALKRAMYRRGRPNALMRLMNRLDVLVYGARRLSPRRTAVLKVVGRRSGKITSVPVAELGAERPGRGRQGRAPPSGS